MGKYHIPPKLIDASKLLSELSDSQFKALIDFYSSSEPGAIKSLLVNESRFDLKASQLNSITELVFNLFNMSEESDPAEKLEDIFNSILDSAEEIQMQEPDRLKDRLIKLISSDLPINKTEKAMRLNSEAQKKIVDCRIVTDIRPVLERSNLDFSDYLIIHNLKIEYRENYETKDFFFLLTSSEMKKLKKAIERAETKENIMIEKLNGLKLTNLKIE